MKDKILKAAAEVKHTLTGDDGQEAEVDGRSVVINIWPSSISPGGWRCALAGDNALVWKVVATLTTRTGWVLDTRYPTLLIKA